MRFSWMMNFLATIRTKCLPKERRFSTADSGRAGSAGVRSSRGGACKAPVLGGGLVVAIIFLVSSAFAQDTDTSAEDQLAADLEAKLRQTLESSDEGARIMLELVDHYYDRGQAFGLLRSARSFVNAQPGHARHQEVMWKLMQGLMVTSRNSEIKSNGLQFLERYPKSPKIAEVEHALATVFERLGQRREAADHYRGSWEKLGAKNPVGAGDAARAFRLYSELRSEVTAKIMGEMALKILDQLPANVSAAQFGVMAMYQTRTYGAQYALSNQVGAKIIQKQLPLDMRQNWEVHAWMGDNYRAEKQYASAIKSYRQAIANGTDYSEVHRNLIRSLYDSQANFADLQNAVNAYVAAFPNETVARRAEMRNILAQAKARDGDIPGALAQAQLVLRDHGGLASSFFSWAKSTADEVRAAPAAVLTTATQAMTANATAQPTLEAAATAAQTKSTAAKKAATDVATALQTVTTANQAALTKASAAKTAGDAAMKAAEAKLTAAKKVAADAATALKTVATANQAALTKATAAKTAADAAQKVTETAVAAAKKVATTAATALTAVVAANKASLAKATAAKTAADTALKAADTALVAAKNAAADNKAKAPGLVQAVATAQTNLDKTVGAKWQVGEQIYQDAVKNNPENLYQLHYYAAFSLYRDYLKDNAKAAQLLRQHILYPAEVPHAGSEFRGALSWILLITTDDAAFRKEVQRHLAHARLHADNQNYGRALESWLASAKKSKDDALQQRYRFAQGEYDKFRNDNTVKLWEKALETRMRGHQAREQLLATKLSESQKRTLLKLHAGDLRNYGDSRRRGEAIPFFQQLAALDSTDYTAARSWVESAANYGDADQSRAALEHMFRLNQASSDPVIWYYASNAARKVEDAALQKRVLQWIRQNQQRMGPSNRYASNIVGNLRAMEMEADALAYMKESVQRDPDLPDTASIVDGLFQLQEEGQPRIQFITPFLTPVSDNYGRYASLLANEHLKLGDFQNFERVCREANAVRSQRLLRSNWSFSLHNWVSLAMQHETWTAEQKATVYRVVADMEYGRDSAVGRLALLAVEGHQLTPVERLLAYRDTTMTSQRDGTSYSYLFPWAQRALGRDEHAEAAALATGLINNIPNVGVDTLASSRSLVREAYGKMGALGMEVSAESPMAPLLEIGLHLRLGDQPRALEAYTANLGLFDEYLLELPAELVAFGADSHITAGGEANHDRAESMLRRWLIEFSESEKFLDSEKAQIQLLLAKNYDRAKRYEVARSEYTTVVNRYPETEEAVEARFGIGETLMAQKIFDQAEETFTELASHPVSKVRVRGSFLLGVLASQKGDSDEARGIFKEVLGSMPDIALANETLYHLAEVYGGERRFLDQLELLRAVGRLGQESKRWHEPGAPLSIVVQDSDLGISRGHAKIPVELVTQPGGDRERTFISSGGAGKGLFIGEIETALGSAIPGNGVIEVSGEDLITVDYPNEFKQEFQFKPLATDDIGLAADADFDMASSRIVDADEETETERLQREQREGRGGIGGDLRQSIQRPDSEIKPGNPIYLRVVDFDRDLTAEPDDVLVKIAASSGDEVQAILRESSAHSGVFEGTVASSDLPAGALATDTAIEHSALMAIDKDPASTWISQPDGLTPKWLAVDLKELRSVTSGNFTTPDPADQAPVRVRLQGSHDGRFWYPLAEHPQRAAAAKPEGEFRRMTQRIWHTGQAMGLTDWQQVKKLTSQEAHEKSEPEELAYASELPTDPEERRRRKADPCAAVWQGTFIQPRAGAVRFAMRGQLVGAMVDNLVVQPIVPLRRETTFDVYLEAGLHELVFFAASSDSGRFGVEVLRARENPNRSEVRPTRFVAEDFDLGQALLADLKPAGDYQLGSLSASDDGKWEYSIEARELRHVRFVIDEYLGQAVAINSVAVSGPEGQFIPTEADLLQLSVNDVMEITPGDSLEATYIDELPTGGQPRNRPLTQRLSATYYNARIRPIAYDFVRDTNGQVETVTKDLLRIDPGERITVEVIDYDLDVTGRPDTVDIAVQVSGGEVVQLAAHETEPTSGVFKVEIDTLAPGAAAAVVADADEEPVGGAEGAAAEEEEAGAEDLPKLEVTPGQQVFLSYRDIENTFPGHAIDRAATVYVREPSAARMRIIETRASQPEDQNGPVRISYLPASSGGEDAASPKGVSYEVPLSIEVIDPDAARDSLSTVLVDVTLDGIDSPPVKVKCRISSAFSELEDTMAGVENPALHQGRFVGQVLMRLGGAESPRLIPRLPDMPAMVGEALAPSDDNAAHPDADGGGDALPAAVSEGMVSVFNVAGSDTIVTRYKDDETPSGEAAELSDLGRLRSNAKLLVTDSDYENEVEALQVGERMFLRLEDADRDSSADRDKVALEISTSNGEKETVELEETLSHSGVFASSLKLRALKTPTPGNLVAGEPEIETFFGADLIATYVDPRSSSGEQERSHQIEVPIRDGTDGDVAAFTKTFSNEKLAVQTQFHIAESYFELFKSHLEIERRDEAEADLKNGRRILRELQEDHPDPEHAPRIAYLLGQFAQELKDWDEAIESYEAIVRLYPDHSLAADAQYKLGQCYEEAERFDDALEAYVTLAATYPQNPLISSVVIRINEHFYRNEDYEVAAKVGEKFLERFANHEFAPRMAFRVGQCYYKNEEYATAGLAFDDFVKRFPEDELTAQALFWAGESYRQGNSVSVAFHRYNRCRWDFPESDAAKYSRGRLALPEMLIQFEREARGVEMEAGQ